MHHLPHLLHTGRQRLLQKLFPGGHVEPGETFKESVIREIYEETGLTIQNPRLTGIYHWMTGDIRNVGFLYKTSEYEGKLISFL
jgi:8-oxo-dGTP diphosphatase